jgi:hypothetical protein
MKNKLGIAAVATLAFCAGIAASIFTLPLWVTVMINAAKEGSRTDWLGFAGGLIGNLVTAVVAGIAIYFAWRGIMRQLRIGIIVREEDRIEGALPGLRDAYDQAMAILEVVEVPTSIDKMTSTFERYQTVGAASFTTEYIPSLPEADDKTRRQFLNVYRPMQAAYMQLRHLERGHQRQRPSLLDQNPFIPAWEVFRETVVSFRAYADRLGERIEKAERDLPALRTEIEQFFHRD